MQEPMTSMAVYILKGLVGRYMTIAASPLCIHSVHSECQQDHSLPPSHNVTGPLRGFPPNGARNGIPYVKIISDGRPQRANPSIPTRILRTRNPGDTALTTNFR